MTLITTDELSAVPNAVILIMNMRRIIWSGISKAGDRAMPKAICITIMSIVRYAIMLPYTTQVMFMTAVKTYIRIFRTISIVLRKRVPVAVGTVNTMKTTYLRLPANRFPIHSINLQRYVNADIPTFLTAITAITTATATVMTADIL